jgi:O-antigen ligase/tetratricopeptide (TPR) repeat protein
MLYLLMALLVLPPLTYYGIDRQLTLTFMEFGSGLLLLLCFYRSLRQKKSFLKAPGLLFLSGFCVLILLQLVPLPPALLSLLSPLAYEHYQGSVWLLDPQAWMPLSVLPKATLSEFLRILSQLFIYWVTVQLLDSKQRLQKVALFLCCAAGIYAFFGLLQFFAPGARILWVFSIWPEVLSHPFGGYVNGNHYAGLMEMLFPLTLTCFFLFAPAVGYGTWRERLVDSVTDPLSAKHILIGIAAVFIAVSVFFSLSRGGTISLVLSTLLLFALLMKSPETRRKTMPLVLLLVFVLGLVGLFGWEPVAARFDGTLSAEGELKSVRPDYWRDSMDMIADQPLFGSGLGTYVDRYQAYQSDHYGGLVNHAHNDYLELLTETGFFGFVLLLCFLLTLVATTWRTWKRRRNRSSRYLYPGALCGLVALLCHGVTDFNFYIPPNGQFFFFLCGFLVAAANVRSSDVRERRDLDASVRWRLYPGLAACALLFIAGALFNGGVLLARTAAAGLDDSEDNQAQLASIGSAVRFDPLESSYRYTQGRLMWSFDQTTDSLAAFTAAVRLRPYYGRYLQETAKLISMQQETGVAEQLFRAGTLVQPGRFLVHLEYGNWLLSCGKNAEALAAFRRGLEIHPQETGRVLTLLTLVRLDPFEMQAALPEQSQSWQHYAQFLETLNADDSASFAFQRAVDLAENEGRSGPYMAYYKYLSKREMDLEALHLLLAGIETFPLNAGFHRTVGVLYERQGIYYRAMEEYRQALQLDPRQDWVKKRLERLEGMEQ